MQKMCIADTKRRKLLPCLISSSSSLAQHIGRHKRMSLFSWAYIFFFYVALLIYLHAACCRGRLLFIFILHFASVLAELGSFSLRDAANGGNVQGNFLNKHQSMPRGLCRSSFYFFFMIHFWYDKSKFRIRARILHQHGSERFWSISFSVDQMKTRSFSSNNVETNNKT